MRTTIGFDDKLTQSELQLMAEFIENKLPAYVAKGQFVLKKSFTGLARTITYNSDDRHAYIHLHLPENKRNGEFADKIVQNITYKVRQALRYDRDNPQIVNRYEEIATRVISKKDLH